MFRQCQFNLRDTIGGIQKLHSYLIMTANAPAVPTLLIRFAFKQQMSMLLKAGPHTGCDSQAQSQVTLSQADSI